MGASPEGSATLNHLLHSKEQQCHGACFSHRARHYTPMCDSSTSLTGCPHTQNARGSIRLVCCAQDSLCAKGQSAAIQAFLLPGTQQQLSQTHTLGRGASSSSPFFWTRTRNRKASRDLKKKKILNHAITVHVQMAGWSLVCLEKPVNTGLAFTNTENKQWGRIIKQLGLSDTPASRLCNKTILLWIKCIP